MFSPYQIYSTIVFNLNEEIDPVTATSDNYNRAVLRLHDLMLHLNLCIVDRAAFAKLIQSVTSQLPKLFEDALNNKLVNNVNDAIAAIYNPIAQKLCNLPCNIAVLPEKGFQSVYKGGYYTKTRYSILPNKMNMAIDNTSPPLIEFESHAFTPKDKEKDKLLGVDIRLIKKLESLLSDPILNQDDQMILMPIVFPVIPEAGGNTSQTLSYVTAHSQAQYEFQKLRDLSAHVASAVNDDEMSEKSINVNDLIEYSLKVFDYMVADYNAHIFFENRW